MTEPGLDDSLARRWARDVRAGQLPIPDRVGSDRGSLVSAGEDLFRRWCEPHRRYHTTAHLFAVLDGVDELADQAEDAVAVRLAAWFHDAVYQGQPGADEENSARLAEHVLPGLGWPPERVAEVARLVRLTADHAGILAGDRNGAVLADADLAVLASDEPGYLNYAQAIRQEYAQVPDQFFIAGRTQALTRLLESAPLYRTSIAQQRWTVAAELNMRAELERLGQNH